MICSSCARENPDEVTYCLDCGRKLERDVSHSAKPTSDLARCARCGADNPVTMNFCKRCGAPLGGSDSGKPPPEEVVKAPEASPSPVVPAPVQAPAVDVGNVSAPKICERCKGALDPDAQFCKYCGLSLTPIDSSPPPAAAAAAAPVESSPPFGGAAEKTGPLGGAPAIPAGGARLVAILKDGSEGQTYPLDREATEIGRKEGNILLPDDPYLSPRHARLLEQGQRYFLKDLASTNGIFIRLREKSRMHHSDILLVGQQVLRFDVLEEAERGLGPASQHGTLVFGTPEGNCIARLCQMTTEGIVRDVYHLRGQEVVIGREGPDIVFPDDPFMSRKHARISYDGTSRTFILEDLGSFNGTSIRFRGERELLSGDQFRVGNHLFLFETGGVAR